MPYGRELLLHGEERNAVLDLAEIQRFGKMEVVQQPQRQTVCCTGVVPKPVAADPTSLLFASRPRNFSPGS
jgi:hypothetical protein